MLPLRLFGQLGRRKPDPVPAKAWLRGMVQMLNGHLTLRADVINHIPSVQQTRF